MGQRLNEPIELQSAQQLGARHSTINWEGYMPQQHLLMCNTKPDLAAYMQGPAAASIVRPDHEAKMI